MKKICYFDVDGTLIDARQGLGVSEATRQAIAELKSRGTITALNTGRSAAFLPADVRALGFDALVGGCGSYVSFRDNIVYNRLFSQEEAWRIVEAFRSARLDMLMEGPEHIYAEPQSFDPQITGLSRHMFEPSHSVRALPANPIEANKISYLVFDQEKDRQLRQTLADFLHFIVYDHALREGLPHGCTKASGMELLEEAIGGPLYVYAFGDSQNDLDMLERADVAVVMGNGCDRVKSKAAHVTGSVAEDGIAAALSHLGLIGKANHG